MRLNNFIKFQMIEKNKLMRYKIKLLLKFSKIISE